MTDDRTIGPENISPETLGTAADLPPTWDEGNSTESEVANDGHVPIGALSTVIEEDVSEVVASNDALAGLVEKTVSDPGAPFTPACLASLAKLKKADRAGFEALRAELKQAGCRVSSLDDAIADESGDFGERTVKEADILIGLAQGAELFHTADGIAYADLDINGHRETWPVRSKGFRLWLARQYYDVEQGAPGSAALQAALGVIEARACYGAPERIVYLRVGAVDGKLYLDLCDDSWRAVEIDTAGWRVIDSPPVRFRRAAGMKGLPVPVTGGSIDKLRAFLNLKSAADFVLVVTWALASLRNHGPYPVIALSGEQGSAKSTFSGLVRSLVDPNTAPLRALPREDRDLFIGANNAHVLAFDNVSGLPGWISDTLCRLATGGGFAVRQLYTDQDEVLFDAAKPVILNGIEDFVTRPDLADRSLFLTLESIAEKDRRPETELRTAFEAERPRILGALLDGVVTGLRRLPDTRLEKLPRMADFAVWATACESAFWPSGTFEAAYRGNRDEAVDNVIDADLVASAVRTMMAGRANWTGTASELLSVLFRSAGVREPKSKSWPETPRALAGRLRRAVTFLRKIGIEVTFSREGRGRARMIHIVVTNAPSELEDGGNQLSASVAPSAPIAESSPVLAVSLLGVVGDDANGPPKDGCTESLGGRMRAFQNNVSVAADDTDAAAKLRVLP